jgi:hypothetical protein
MAPSVPIVFTNVIDPVGSGFVDSLAQPGGNITGFTTFEYSMGGKWLQLLKEIAPGVTRAAVLRDPTIATGPAQFAAIQALAPSLGVELRPVDVRDEGEIERAIALFAQSPSGGLIVTGSLRGVSHRDLIITLAARHRLPAVYFAHFWTVRGGLISYGPVPRISPIAAQISRLSVRRLCGAGHPALGARGRRGATLFRHACSMGLLDYLTTDSRTVRQGGSRFQRWDHDRRQPSTFAIDQPGLHFCDSFIGSKARFRYC